VIIAVALALVAFIYTRIVGSNSTTEEGFANSVSTLTGTGFARLADSVRAECPNGFSNFSSSEMNIRFCYPSKWGFANLEPAEDSGGKGTAREVSFSVRPGIAVSAVSEDWVPRGERMESCSDAYSFSKVSLSGEYRLPTSEWQTSDDGASGKRKIADASSDLFITESVGSREGGVCLRGFSAVRSSPFTMVTASYFVEVINDDYPRHITNPFEAIPKAERGDFEILTASVRKIQ